MNGIKWLHISRLAGFFTNVFWRARSRRVTERRSSHGWSKALELGSDICMKYRYLPILRPVAELGWSHDTVLFMPVGEICISLFSSAVSRRLPNPHGLICNGKQHFKNLIESISPTHPTRTIIHHPSFKSISTVF